MSDVSNEDIMKLIYRIIKKQDVMEKTLNKVLELVESQKKDFSKKYHIADSSDFLFYPIANDEELQKVSEKVQKNSDYRNALLKFLGKKRDVIIEDLFTPDFLYGCNIKGLNGKKGLESMVLYDQIFIPLKKREGIPEKHITKVVANSLENVKRRINRRVKLGQQPPIQDNKAINNQEDLSLEMDCNEIPEIEEEFIDMDEMVKNESDFEEHDDTDIEEEEDKVLPISLNDFKPIKNDKELKTISDNIRKDALYTKKTRLQLVTASSDGLVKLSQLFDMQFMKDYNLYGIAGKKNLSKLLPYKTFYFEIRKELGDSLKEIETQATREIQMMHNRYKIQLERKNKG
uniref:CSON002870 protein n=1 Tax=Culicoides sonorensis TaxID=179676 RepID=A0A336MY51_CULSO